MIESTAFPHAALARPPSAGAPSAAARGVAVAGAAAAGTLLTKRRTWVHPRAAAAVALRGGIRWWASSSSSHASSFACHRSFSCSEATRRAATSAFALRNASVMIAMMIVATTHVHRHVKSSIRMIDDTGSFS